MAKIQFILIFILVHAALCPDNIIFASDHNNLCLELGEVLDGEQITIKIEDPIINFDQTSQTESSLVIIKDSFSKALQLALLSCNVFSITNTSDIHSVSDGKAIPDSSNSKRSKETTLKALISSNNSIVSLDIRLKVPNFQKSIHVGFYRLDEKELVNFILGKLPSNIISTLLDLYAEKGRSLVFLVGCFLPSISVEGRELRSRNVTQAVQRGLREGVFEYFDLLSHSNFRVLLSEYNECGSNANIDIIFQAQSLGVDAILEGDFDFINDVLTVYPQVHLFGHRWGDSSDAIPLALEDRSIQDFGSLLEGLGDTYKGFLTSAFAKEGEQMDKTLIRPYEGLPDWDLSLENTLETGKHLFLVGKQSFAKAFLERGVSIARKLLEEQKFDEQGKSESSVKYRYRFRPENLTIQLAEGLRYLGLIRLGSGHHLLARQLLEESLKYNSEDIRSKINLFSALYYQRDYQRGFEIGERVLAEDPSQHSVRHSLGEMYSKYGKFHKAESHFKDLLNISVQPVRIKALDSLGEMYLKYGKFDRAEEQFREWLKISPDNLQAKSRLVAALVGRYVLAYRRAIQDDRVSDEEGEEMIELMNSIVSLDQDGREWTIINLAELYILYNQNEKSFNLLNEFLSRHRDRSNNKAPALKPNNPNVAAVVKGDSDKKGTLVSLLINDVIDDSDDALTGIAIIEATGKKGSWQYNLGGLWIPVGNVSNSSALLLRSKDYVRYLYENENREFTFDSATITYRAWNQTFGSPGTKVNTTPNVDITAFSAVTDTASIPGRRELPQPQDIAQFYQVLLKDIKGQDYTNDLQVLEKMFKPLKFSKEYWDFDQIRDYLENENKVSARLKNTLLGIIDKAYLISSN